MGFRSSSAHRLLTFSRLTINTYYEFDELDDVGTDDFIFEYQDGNSWVELFRISSSNDIEETYTFDDVPTPLTLSVRDSDRSLGNNGRDRVAIDYISLRCYNDGSPTPTPTPSPTPTPTPTPTPPAGGIDLSAQGYKDHGDQYVELSWSPSGTTTDVMIYRTSISGKGSDTSYSEMNDGSHTDPTGTKGGSVYEYQVCEIGGSAVCSDVETVTF